VIDFLYIKRNHIAFSLGLLTEVPIAVCSGEYEFDRGLIMISQQNDSTSQMPLAQAEEINLFVSPVCVVSLTNTFTTFDQVVPVENKAPRDPHSISVFQPPAKG
jgi:hypothetical protein